MESTRPARHGPNRLANYISIHETVLDQFVRSEFLAAGNTIAISPIPRGFVLAGEVGCLGGIVIQAVKLLEVVGGPDDDPFVQTEEYAYNVSVRHRSNLFRYDNQHSWPGHPDNHHKHLFDWPTGEEFPESPIWIGSEKWPLFSEVIEEARAWYWDHASELTAEFPDNLNQNVVPR